MMKKLMILLAAVAMVGAIHAAASYEYSAEVFVQKYTDKDSGEGAENAGVVFGLLSDARSRAGGDGDNGYSHLRDLCRVVGENFEANKNTTIYNAQAVSYHSPQTLNGDLAKLPNEGVPNYLMKKRQIT